MKKVFTLSAFFMFTTLFLTSCVKNTLPDNNEDRWLSKEQGEVVYSDAFCNYYIVETYNGYNVVRTYGNYKPYEGSIVYGNFSNTGTRDLYNYSTRVVFTGTITDYWLDYYEAQDAIDFYCPFYGKGETGNREIKKSTLFKK